MSARRRGVLAALGGAAIAAPSLPAIAAPLPDADLLACCARWAAAENGYSVVTEPWGHTMDDPSPEVEAAADAYWTEAQAALQCIQDTPALTVEGWLAKARIAMRMNLAAGGHSEVAREMALGVLRDLLADDPFLTAHDTTRAAMSRIAGISRAGGKRGEPLYDEANHAKMEAWRRFEAMGVTGA